MAPQPLSALMAQIARGDRDAFTQLYDQTSRLVYGLAFGAVPEPRGAEEVALEVYLRVWRTAGTFDRGQSSVLTWLAAITRELAMEWTEHHPARENHAMDGSVGRLLVSQKEVA